MSRIIKIVIKGCSGYGPYNLAYDDKLTITNESIQYLYKPVFPSENHQSQKWYYRTNKPEFRQLWDNLCTMLPNILKQERELVLDGCETTFTITYEDKSKATTTCWSPNEEMIISCLKIIKRMVPPCEKEPAVLWISDE